MSTLIAISLLGIICLLLEILNLRKILVPFTLVALVGIMGMTAAELYHGTSYCIIDLHNMIVSTAYSQAFSILFILLAILVLAMSPAFYKEKIANIADYVAIKIFLLAGAVAMVSFGNLAMFFIGLEVLSVAAYVLAASDPKNVKSNEAGMKYFIMGAFASSFVLFGIALVYGAVGSFDVATITAVSLTPTAMPIWLTMGFSMIIVGLLFKASIVPFHFWAPDVYEGSPTLVTATMSTLVKVAALGTLFKIVSILAVEMNPSFQMIILVLSILSMTVGNLSAMQQTNMKRMMAFSGISHAGFMLMTLMAVGLSANTMLYYAAAYGLAGIASFAVIMAVCQGEDDEDISHFYGLAKRKPLLAAVLTGALLSLSGIPLFAGFFAKFFVFNQMLQAGHLVLVIFGILNAIVAVCYYFRVVNVLFTKEPTTNTALIGPKEYVWVAVVAIGLNLLLGIFPSIVMGLAL